MHLPKCLGHFEVLTHTLATSECQELASIFEENAKQNLAGMMELHEKSIYDVQRYIQWPEINLRDEHSVLFPSSKSSKTIMKGLRPRFKQRRLYLRNIFKNC